MCEKQKKMVGIKDGECERKQRQEGSEAFNEQLLKEVAVKTEKANGSGSQ